MVARTLQVPELAAVLGVSTRLVYQSVEDGTCPVPAIRIGKHRIVFARSAVEELLGESLVPVDGTP
jgi:excisionase family DNA binding protein